jgi:hypothetical protein
MKLIQFSKLIKNEDGMGYVAKPSSSLYSLDIILVCSKMGFRLQEYAAIYICGHRPAQFVF